MRLPVTTDIDCIYDVSVSYAGRYRDHVRLFCRILKETAPSLLVFVDYDYLGQFVARDGISYFDNVFSRESRFCVVFASAQYLTSRWCRSEWAAISRRVREQRERPYAFIATMDGTFLPGQSKRSIYFNAKTLSLHTIVRELLIAIGYDTALVKQPLLPGKTLPFVEEVRAVRKERRKSARPAELVRQGLLHFSIGQYISAEDCFRRAAVEQSHPETYFHLGRACFQLGDYEDAKAAYTLCIEGNPNDYAAYNNRGLCHERLNQLEEAIKDYATAARVNPRFLTAKINRTIALAASGALIESRRKLKYLGKRYPQKANIFYNHGKVCLELFKKQASESLFREGVTSFRKTIALVPEHSKAYNDYGVLVLQRGDLARAVELFTRAAHLAPRDPVCRMSLGDTEKRMSLRQRDPFILKKAVTTYHDAMKCLLSLPIHSPIRGKLHYYSKICDQLGAAYLELTRLQPELREAHLKTAKLYLDRAVSEDEKNAMAHVNRGLLFQRRAQFKRASEEYKLAAELNPELAVARFNIACMEAVSGAKQKAVQQLEKALELDPTLASDALQEEAFKSVRKSQPFKKVVAKFLH